ncbi:MAG: cell wall hydrolase [Lachnospiraceae bacterium]|nr:cell wall hydrolase [Lachnospiraceae bacterium]
MKKKYVSRLLAGCLTVTMLTPTGALASVPQPVVTQEASQEAGQENETENKEQTEEYVAEGAAEVQTDETEAAENRTAADKSREQTEPQTAQTGEQAEPQTTQTGEQAASEAEPQAQVQPRAVVDVNQWIRNGNRWWYRHADGSYTTNGWEVINGAWYYFDGAGWMVTGWLKRPSGWYYLTGSGAMATGWIQLGSTWYYLNESGTMLADTWIGNNYVDGSGAWIPGKVKAQAGWIQSGSRWWYRHADGSYTRNNWEMINGSWYYFDGAGWMVTGWLKLGNNWYYLNPGHGAMVTGWLQLGSTWYYLKPTAKNSAEKVGEKAYNYWVGTAGIGGYYIDKYGRMVAGKDYSLGSYVYTFDVNGLCTNRENRYLQVTDANGRKYNVEKKTYLSDPQVGVDVTEDEFLAAAVYAESANQGLTGMTGVAMVMLNRMRTNKTSSAPYPSEAKNMIYQATQFEVARDGALTKSLNLIVSGKGGTAMENAKKAVANARAICDAYDNNKTDELSDEVKGILEELKVPEGHTMLEYLGFMTPKAFENANLDPEKTYAFTYKNTTFYSTWIKKS